MFHTEVKENLLLQLRESKFLPPSFCKQESQMLKSEPVGCNWKVGYTSPVMALATFSSILLTVGWSNYCGVTHSTKHREAYPSSKRCVQKKKIAPYELVAVPFTTQCLLGIGVGTEKQWIIIAYLRPRVP